MIDRVVYAAYGLGADEIAIVEGTSSLVEVLSDEPNVEKDDGDSGAQRPEEELFGIADLSASAPSHAQSSR